MAQKLLRHSNFTQIEVLFENTDIIAVNKPEGIASISENDISKAALHWLLEKKISDKLFIVHRIDKEVSGVILFAKNPKAHKFINNQFAVRSIKKQYIALVHGIIKENDGVIDKPIRQFGSGRMGIDEQRGKPSETKYHVVSRFTNYTLLELNPSTGRRHQLRAHLYAIGNPIVGDVRYGNRSVQQKFPRLMLHAKQIEFHLPNNERITVEAPLPESFKKLLNICAAL